MKVALLATDPYRRSMTPDLKAMWLRELRGLPAQRRDALLRAIGWSYTTAVEADLRRGLCL